MQGFETRKTACVLRYYNFSSPKSTWINLSSLLPPKIIQPSAVPVVEWWMYQLCSFFFLSRPQYLLGSYHVNVFPHKVLYNTYSDWALQAYYPTIQAQVLSKPHIKSELEENSAAVSTKLVYTSLFISWNSVLWLKLRRQLHTCDSVPNSENDLLTQWRKAVVSFCNVLFKVFDRKKKVWFNIY